MRFTILQQDFLSPLQSAARSVGVRSTLPVLDNILLSAQGSKLKIAATNLEIGIIKFVPAQIEEEGEITVPAKTLLELTQSLGQVKIDVQTEGDILTITAGKFKASLNGISATEFPAIPLSSEVEIEFKKDDFITSAQVLFASAVDEGRPILTGILTHASSNKLDFVATDGFRLAHRQVKLEAGRVGDFKSLIPRRTFEEVIKVVSEEPSDMISLSSAQNQVVFKIGESIISSRLIEGQFPSWEKIIPSQIVARVIVEKDEFLKAIKLAAIFAKGEANIIVLKTEKDKLTLESSAKELGSQQNEVETTLEGENIQIAFNAKFLIDAISFSPSSQIMIEFSGPLSASLIKPVGVEGLEYIVMPVRLS